ncbi:MAG: hypothetical protein Kow0077_14040 [Anaerolineae bacterium]
MNRTRAVVMAVAGLAVLVGVLLVASTIGIGAQNEFGPKPTFVPAEALTPVPTPDDGRQVAILTLVVEGEREDLRGIQLERGRIITGYGPNVAGRPGEWTVIVSGERELTFGIEDPRRFHVYGEGEEREQPAHSSEIVGSLVFDLVVPLHDVRGADLQAKEIRILDQSGNEIFVTEIDREGWAEEQR